MTQAAKPRPLSYSEFYAQEVAKWKKRQEAKEASDSARAARVRERIRRRSGDES